jgi:hypothetical protein
MTADFTGVWKANLEKSKLLGPTPKAVLARISHLDPEIVVEILTTKMDSSEDRLVYKALTTGEEFTNSVHGLQIRSRCEWNGMELLIESWMDVKGRQVHFRDFWSLSSDGQTLTMEHRDDDLAGQITFLGKAS